jgi:hypothetical protein
MVESDAAPVSDSHLLNRLAGGWKTRTDGRFNFVVRNGAFYLEQDEDLAAPYSFSQSRRRWFLPSTGVTFGATRFTASELPVR